MSLLKSLEWNFVKKQMNQWFCGEDKMGLNIFDNTPREIMCIRNDEDGMIVGSSNHHLLEIGEIYHVNNIEVYSWHTLIYLDEFPGKEFNSVAFNEVD